DGTLLPGVHYDMGGGPQPESPVVADFNRDRKPDIAAINGASSVGVILGKGDGTFKPPSTYPAGYGPFTEAVGDLNHDRYPDLVVVNYASQTVSVLLNDGNWTAPVPPPGPGPSAEPPAALPADASGSANPSPARVQLADHDAAVAAGRPTSTVVAPLL